MRFRPSCFLPCGVGGEKGGGRKGKVGPIPLESFFLITREGGEKGREGKRRAQRTDESSLLPHARISN